MQKLKHVLTPQDKKFLSSERSRERKLGILVDVNYTRRSYRLSNVRARRLARFQDAEDTVRRLAMDLDVLGPQKMDKERAWCLISLLEDTFNIGPNNERLELRETDLSFSKVKHRRR